MGEKGVSMLDTAAAGLLVEREKKRKILGLKCLADERGQRRTYRLVIADKKAIVSQIYPFYTCSEQKDISKHTTV